MAKEKERTVKVSQSLYFDLRAMAQQKGFFYRGRPSVVALLRSIVDAHFEG